LRIRKNKNIKGEMIRIPVKLNIEDRGCNYDRLARLYEEGNSKAQLMEMFGVRDQKVMNRWFKQCGIEERDNNSKYVFNKYYFDIIDSEEKAYWLGFVWCDGYVCRRERKSGVAYEFKLSLAEQDLDHLYKLNEALKSNYEIKKYVGSQGYKTDQLEVRLYISNKYFAKNLYDKYGMIPRRSEVDTLIDSIPEKFHKHFIRGVYDAEGSLSAYYTIDNGYRVYKNALSITTYEKLIDFIQDHMIKNGLSNSKLKTIRRHEDGDAHCVALRYCGAVQVPNTLDYLYDGATIYLKRRYDKYIKIKNENGGKPNGVEKESSII
jgi:hypothetical protein